MSEKLQKIMSRAGLTSRRRAEEWIAQGRVTVNGIVATLGDRADPACDKICVDGRVLQESGRRVVVLLNKPRGYVCTLSDPQGRRLVTDLVQEVPERLYPVGRLDYNSEGLLLLTNDGELANHLMHPRHHIEKCYLVKVRGLVTPQTLATLSKGVTLEDGLTAPAVAQNLRHSGSYSWFEIVLHEGKNRQVRRMCEAVGHDVLRLKRIRIDILQIGSLGAGSFRRLTDAEVAHLRRGLSSN
ncbi:MAG: pseudouridine synthase [Desulfuromonas sp.]|nr:MAG: pseudouridine synthase [Desulfuromonas sp.]